MLRETSLKGSGPQWLLSGNLSVRAAIGVFDEMSLANTFVGDVGMWRQGAKSCSRGQVLGKRQMPVPCPKKPQTGRAILRI
jgi:hypothetical protein